MRHEYYDRETLQLAPLVMFWGIVIGFCMTCWYGVFRLIEWATR